MAEWAFLSISAASNCLPLVAQVMGEPVGGMRGGGNGCFCEAHDHRCHFLLQLGLPCNGQPSGRQSEEAGQGAVLKRPFHPRFCCFLLARPLDGIKSAVNLAVGAPFSPLSMPPSAMPCPSHRRGGGKWGASLQLALLKS